MKDYLKEPLTEDEKAFIYGIIRKTSLKYARKYGNIKKREIFSIDDDDVSEELFSDSNSEEFIDKILDTKILRDISVLKPYSQYEKEKIVAALEKVALNSGMKKFITPLTFNEKLVVFLLYIENYQINEISILLNASRMAIWRRDKSIKNKIRKVKGCIENE